MNNNFLHWIWIASCILLLLCTSLLATAQEENNSTISGRVLGADNESLVGATVYWLENSTGVLTNSDGDFVLNNEGIVYHWIVVSFVGYVADTIQTEGIAYHEVSLKESALLKEVEVSGQRDGTFISSVNPIKTEIITDVELAKAACCDLAGCFGTEASVEANTTNIITNAKELRILGLSGVYNQVLIDGFPLIQGLTYTYGISSIPGSLVKTIYVAKGTNSVLQGYESIAGQINVIPKDPAQTNKLFVNAYANSFAETQLNVNYAHQLKKWSTLLAVHTAQPGRKMDRDEDNFLDMPLTTRYSIYNKWKYGNELAPGWHSQITWRLVDENRVGGQTNFKAKNNKGSNAIYGQTVQLTQPELFAKTGYRFNAKNQIVLMATAFTQQQNAYYGTTQYDAQQINGYANLQYDLTWRTQNSLKAGASYRYFNLEEDVAFTANDGLDRTYAGNYKKLESIPGIFAENTYYWKDEDKLVLITGARIDFHNDFGAQFTPRALLKYRLTDKTNLRLSAGTGWRTANVFSENINLLASSRDVVFSETLEPEKAINYGTSLTHNLTANNWDIGIVIDAYHTRFSNQIFPDYDTDPTKAYLTNFTGTSVGNGLKTELNLSWSKRFTAKMAYNYLDVYRILKEEKWVLPFNATHKLMGAFSYQPFNKKWQFDTNMHWYGEQRLAKTSSNPEAYQLPEKSKPYTVINAQITKSWDRLEVYGGCENIFDFRQKRPILSWENPFSPYFDTASVWGPTKGREFYVGLRFKIE